MPELNEITYSRDETVAVVRDYLSFLSKLYVDDSLILQPPQGGWPGITQETLRCLGKTDQVIDLLRHLPYIRGSCYGGHVVQAVPDGPFADWTFIATTNEDDDYMKELTEGFDFYQDVPPHVVGLTARCESDDPQIFLLDTELGIIHWYQCPPEIKYNLLGAPDLPKTIDDEPEDYAPENEHNWRREAPAWAVADFFEILKYQYRTLNFIPINSTKVIDVFLAPRNKSIPMLQEIYRAHGWPDEERYRKEECLAAVGRYWEEKIERLVSQ